ncbi:hypothetical protein Sste5346_009799 [Sporothrix stenoceras]|uniref:Zn(2)-C6 fungal-type domain-containing protein n=1 Tax=Sporothrix stenoceras TaxID=5173 RepID=A0ABR3YIM1_9PEZI
MSLTPAQVMEARRRKVRKGTHSCWECRRRKIRCQFSSPDDTVCIGCRARGSACRSQEFADETPSPQQQVPEKKVAQRLDRLETMMQQLMTHVMAGPSQQQQQPQQHQQQQQTGPPDEGPAVAHAATEARRKSQASHDQEHHGHHHASGAASSSENDDTNDSLRHYNVEQDCPQDCGAYDETAYEHIKKIYKNPAEIVAHVCPTAAGKQGYGLLDVLDTSTADDTPVAALLGIQDSLSNNNGGGSGGGSSPHHNPLSSNSIANSATTAVSAVLGATTGASLGHNTGLSPGSMDGANSPSNGGHGSISGSTGGASHEARGQGNSSGSAASDSAGTATTKDSSVPSSSMLYTRMADPVSEEWRRHRHLSRLLLSLFPTQDDVNTIATGAPTQYIATLFHSKHEIASGRSEPVTKLREIPPMSSHPTAIARRLLQLTLCMQQMAPCFVLQNKLQMKEPMSDVISRIAGVVSHTVTSNDELIGSVEGLECLVLLGQQQSNTGQLRKAWLSYRRAMSLAQLMGLDRGNTRAMKSCDPTSDPRLRPTPAAMWYRINACDRYVSLLLGLRAGSQDDEGYSPSKQTSENGPSNSTFEDDMDTPVETLEKAHTVLSGRIIERNHSKISLEKSYAVTQAIDADLQAAASRNLGPTWWEVPSYDPYARPDFIFSEMSRSILQVHHHCILILLHLPYMLRGEHPAAAAAKMMAASSSAATSMCEGHGMGNTPTNPGTNEAEPSPHESIDERRSCSGGLAYSKATCLQSSRAVLKRFTHFRLLVNTAFSCRHVDYASLIAAMTLIIGYLGPRPAPNSDPNILDAFDNQLRQDRAMVEQVRECMERVGKANNDKLSRESAATIQQLMPILDLVAKKPESEVAAVETAGGSSSLSPRHMPTNTSGGHGHSGSLTSPARGGGDYTQDSNMRNATSPYGGGNVGIGATNVGTPGTPAGGGSAVRLNVPYFGTVNIHTNAATGMSSMSPHYPHPPQTPYQEQQQQQQLHHDLSIPPTGASPAGTTNNPATNTIPVSYDLFTPPTASQPVLDWGGSMPHQQHQDPQQANSVDLNAMLVDFDPMPMSDDGSGGAASSAPGGPGSDGLFGFGGVTAFPDMTGSSDDWVMQGVDTTYWSLLNGGGGSFGGQMG